MDHTIPAPWREAILSSAATATATATATAVGTAAAPDGGLVLWQAADEGRGPQFRLRLTEGRDVTTEGGLSVVLEIDGAPLSVLSFSFVPGDVLAIEGAGHRVVPFIARKQTSMDEVARAAFARRFDRANPAGMTFAGFSALVQMLGHGQAYGIRSERHPAWRFEHAAVFANAYDGFWQTLSGRGAGRWAWEIALPGHYAPVEEMTAARRARALRRRAHLEAVEMASRATLAAL